MAIHDLQRLFHDCIRPVDVFEPVARRRPGEQVRSPLVALQFYEGDWLRGLGELQQR